MSPRFAVLASGSSGNACLLQVDDFGVLIDAGLGPREMERRLAAVGASWESIDALLLTHTHADHWREGAVARLLERRIPVYCHARHERALRASSSAFEGLRNARLVRLYGARSEFRFPANLRCRPLPVQHDAGATFGFRFERSADLFGSAWAMGYASDLGCWDGELALALSGVDLLALEFNHDEEMQRLSGRSRWLIRRVLGERGHLSNEQAGELLRQIVENSTPGRLQHVVQLHLSRECNRPALAAAAARRVLGESCCDAAVITAEQHEPVVVAGARTAAPPVS